MITPTAPSAGVTRIVAAAVAANVIALLPVFLLGALSVFIARTLSLNAADVGIAIGSFFIGVCVTSVPNGRIAERLGMRLTLVLFAAASAAAMLVYSFGGGGLLLLVPLSLAAGAIGGLGQLAANMTLGRALVGGSLGLAFGISQSAIPAASFLAGMAVPLFSGEANWRLAFVVGAVLAGMFAATSGSLIGEPPLRRPTSDTRPRDAEHDHASISGAHARRLFWVACGSMFGSVATIPVLTFLVPAAVRIGFAASVSGYLLAVVSILTVVVRVILGACVHRLRGRHFVVIASMLVVGAVGTAWLGVGTDDHVLFIIAALLSLTIGNGWHGVMFYTVVHSHRDSPAVASAVVLAGGSLGAAVGPIAFGIIVEAGSFDAAWLMTASAGVMAACFMVLASRGFRTA